MEQTHVNQPVEGIECLMPPPVILSVDSRASNAEELRKKEKVEGIHSDATCQSGAVP
jgi:hypothetical protein